MAFFKKSRVTSVMSIILEKFGIEIKRSVPVSRGAISMKMLEKHNIPIVEKIAASAADIPGMLSEESGKNLYLLCNTQLLKGDVVEIGSWQGYSTSFLACAVRDSANGELFAIDHFCGNIGTQEYYVVGETDLSDLRNNFERNMKKVGVWDYINLLDMPNSEAAKILSGHTIRFLFIDGDHSREGVEKDVALFFPMLVPGSIVVFDDFSDEASGVVEAIDSLLEQQSVSRVFSYPNTFVLVIG